MTSSVPAFEQPLHVGRPNIANPEEFVELVRGALERKWLSNDGPLLKEFESKVSDFLGVKHCVAITNGTIALEIMIRAAGLSGEVILPSWTFVATAHALTWLGITPVFADIDPVTQCLDPNSVEAKITDKTTGIIGVHLWGRPAPVVELQQIATKHGLTLLFDAAHAFGVSVGNKLVGNFGQAEVLSFHATKFFNAIEGGAIVTNDDEFAAKSRLMRNFGFAGEDNVVSVGTNGKMTEVSAAMGLSNFEGLHDLIDTNLKNYKLYEELLNQLPGVSVLPIDSTNRSNYQYVVLLVSGKASKSRDSILASLRANNVLARKYFWPACHRMEPYRSKQPSAGESLPITEEISEQVIVLPSGTSVSEEAIQKIVRIVADALRS